MRMPHQESKRSANAASLNRLEEERSATGAKLTCSMAEVWPNQDEARLLEDENGACVARPNSLGRGSLNFLA